MKFTDENNSLLLIVDVQEKLLNAVFNKISLEKKAKTFAHVCMMLDIPVVITEQYPKGLGGTVKSIADIAQNACVLEKTSFNALASVEIYNAVKNLNKKNIIVFGIETHICVYQTVKALLNAGYEVTVIKDASGSRSEDEHSSGLSVMKDMGAEIKTAEMVIFEILKTSKHPKFKEIQALIK